MIRHNGIEIDCKRMVITNGEHQFMFPPHARRRAFPIACHLILNGGITKSEIFHQLYGWRADGGPIGYTKQISVFFCQSKPKYKAMGLKLVKEHRGEENVYWLAQDVV